MRSHGIVMAAPDLDEDVGLGAAAEVFHAEALVAELAVEAFVVAVLPRLAGVDQRGVNLGFGEPLQDGVAHELGSVIRPQEGWRALRADQAAQDIDDAVGTDAASNVDGKTFARELIDDGKALELLPIGAGVVHKIVGPDLVRPASRQWARP